jgi:hypothetical protein
MFNITLPGSLNVVVNYVAIMEATIPKKKDCPYNDAVEI